MRFRSRRPVALAAAVAMVFVLAGCWPVPGGNGDRTAHNPFEEALTTATVPDLTPAWTADLGSGNSGPVVLDGGALFVRVDRSVSGLDARTGATRWTWSAPDEAPFAVGEPLPVDGRVLVGYGFGNLGGHWTGIALDPRTGDPVGGPVASGLLSTARGTIVASDAYSHGSGTPVLVGYQLTDVSGATTVNGGALSLETGGSGSRPRLTIGEHGVYHAGNGLVPGDVDGWGQGRAVRRFPHQVGTGCGPSGATIFACPGWVTPMDTTTEVVIGPGETTLYVGRTGGSVAALDASTGALQWTAAVGADVTATPALADGILYVPTADGDLVAVDAAGCGSATCTPLWSAPVDGTALAQQPAVAGSGGDAVVFAGTQGGTLAALPAAGCGAVTCTPLWQASVGATVTGAPAVSAGRVVVGTQGGQIAAFHLPPG